MDIPLLWGEGGPKGRVRGTEKFLYPSPAASQHPLPSGEGFVTYNTLLLTLLRFGCRRGRLANPVCRVLQIAAALVFRGLRILAKRPSQRTGVVPAHHRL